MFSGFISANHTINDKRKYKVKLLFKQRLNWRIQYDVYDEEGKVAFFVQSEVSTARIFHIYDGQGRDVGFIRHKVLTLPATYEMFVGGQYVGCITKEAMAIPVRFSMDCKGWRVEGKHLEFEYSIFNSAGHVVATISKELFKTTDSYWINVANPDDALYALMLVLAIDANKETRRD